MDWTGERFVPGEGGAQIFYEHAHRYLLASPLAAGREAVDLASGEGYGAAWLARGAARLTGLDAAPDAVAHARRRYGTPGTLEFVVGELVDLLRPCFPELVLLGQRVVPVSLLWPLAEQSGPPVVHVTTPGDDGRSLGLEALSPVYIVAIAARHPSPELDRLRSLSLLIDRDETLVVEYWEALAAGSSR